MLTISLRLIDVEMEEFVSTSSASALMVMKEFCVKFHLNSIHSLIIQINSPTTADFRFLWIL